VEQNEGMKRTLLFVLALAVIPVAVDAQNLELEQIRALAEQGYADAQYNLGIMYADGRGVPQDDAEALRWWRLAAEQGGAEAQYNLGNMYADGRGVPQDDAEALRWWRLAAEQGGAEAQFNLGIMYADGRGVPQDDVEAVRWYRLAAEQGLADAQNNLGLRLWLVEAVAEGQPVAVEHLPGAFFAVPRLRGLLEQVEMVGVQLVLAHEFAPPLLAIRAQVGRSRRILSLHRTRKMISTGDTLAEIS
jgi:hypothetical protein